MATPFRPSASMLRLLPVLLAGLLLWQCDQPNRLAAQDEGADEILFHVNRLTVSRSQVESEFLALVPVERLADPHLPPARRKQVLDVTWQQALATVLEGAILQSQSHEQLDYLAFIARVDPQALNDAVERMLADLERRFGGAALLERQLKRFHIDRTQLRQRLLVREGVSMFLRQRFSSLSKSTPAQQRAYYREHPLEFARSGQVRLQRLVFRELPADNPQAEELKTGAITGWQQAQDPDGFAAELQRGPFFLAAWTALEFPAAVEPPADEGNPGLGDWIHFDKLPDLLQDAATRPIGAILGPFTLADLRRQQAFSATGPTALRPVNATDQGQALFRIAAQKIVPIPFDEARDTVKARLDGDIFRAAKVEFLETIRKTTRVTAEHGESPPISPWLYTVRFTDPDALVPQPAPTPMLAPPPPAAPEIRE